LKLIVALTEHLKQAYLQDIRGNNEYMKKSLILISFTAFFFHASISKADGWHPKQFPALSETECQAVGGEMRYLGLSETVPMQCDVPTKDANKSCNSSDQCEGYCVTGEIAPSKISSTMMGSCSGRREVFGCNNFIENGKPYHVCID